jgi:hypothetical protein
MPVVTRAVAHSSLPIKSVVSTPSPRLTTGASVALVTHACAMLASFRFR